MIPDDNSLRVFLAPGPTDLRKSIDTLAILVAGRLNQQPLSGHLFGFCNRRRDTVKILYWDRNGFCLWHKRLERDRFLWPENEDAVRMLSLRQLRWLLDGLSIDQAAHRSLHYGKIC